MKLIVNQTTPSVLTETIRGEKIKLPDQTTKWIHLQFRRFAGCPVCNFHLMTMAKRQEELKTAGIREIVVFHSSAEEMMKYQAQLPFDCIADLDKALYRQFGVEKSWLAILHPRVLLSGARWFLSTGRLYKKAENGILGLPADFLINQAGKIIALKYGTHADDHWSTDEILNLVKPYQ